MPVNDPTSAVAGRSCSQNSIYQVKRGPITSLQHECDRMADEPLPDKVTKPTLSSALDSNDMSKPQPLIFFKKKVMERTT